MILLFFLQLSHKRLSAPSVVSESGPPPDSDDDWPVPED